MFETAACMTLDMLALADFLSAAVVFVISFGMITVPFAFKSMMRVVGCDEVTIMRDVDFDLCR